MNTKVTGTVVKKHDTCAVVKVERMKIHRIYGKQYKVTKNVHVHDADNQCGIGDTVEVEETKPVSKLKHWKISKVINKL